MTRITAAVAGAILVEAHVVIGADLAEAAGATLAATGVDLITADAAMPVETVADAVDLITVDAETTVENITNGTSADAETTAETVANVSAVDAAMIESVGAGEDAPRLKPTTP